MQGKEAAAESEWNFACDRISVGCSRYTDRDWLSRIRRCTIPQAALPFNAQCKAFVMLKLSH